MPFKPILGQKHWFDNKNYHPWCLFIQYIEGNEFGAIFLSQWRFGYPLRRLMRLSFSGFGTAWLCREQDKGGAR